MYINKYEKRRVLHLVLSNLSEGKKKFIKKIKFSFLFKIHAKKIRRRIGRKVKINGKWTLIKFTETSFKRAF
jgi:hypothetical protein